MVANRPARLKSPGLRVAGRERAGAVGPGESGLPHESCARNYLNGPRTPSEMDNFVRVQDVSGKTRLITGSHGFSVQDACGLLRRDRYD